LEVCSETSEYLAVHHKISTRLICTYIDISHERVLLSAMVSFCYALSLPMLLSQHLFKV
jgi:hypothetical protein